MNTTVRRSAFRVQGAAGVRRRGLSLAEVMISLTITATLLVAMAAAFGASTAAIQVNDQFFRATQAGRVAVAQVAAAVRRCQDCAVGDTYDGEAAWVKADKLSFRGTDDKYYHYQYNPTDKTLTLTDEAAGKTYVLAHNVERSGTDPVFAADMAPDPATQVMRPVRVTATFTVQIGENVVRLSASGVPRRSAVY